MLRVHERSVRLIPWRKIFVRTRNIPRWKLFRFLQCSLEFHASNYGATDLLIRPYQRSKRTAWSHVLAHMKRARETIGRHLSAEFGACLSHILTAGRKIWNEIESKLIRKKWTVTSVWVLQRGRFASRNLSDSFLEITSKNSFFVEATITQSQSDCKLSFCDR